MHPFLDGNGRTARAMEALMLQRVGLRDTLFIAMSNYYYEEKPNYLKALSEKPVNFNHDLTPFLKFALKGIEKQCSRLFSEIRLQVAKALYRNTVTDLFGLNSHPPRKRVMSDRHVQLLQMLLDNDNQTLAEIGKRASGFYKVRNPRKALIRDLNYLIMLEAIAAKRPAERPQLMFSVNLDWPNTNH